MKPLCTDISCILHPEIGGRTCTTCSPRIWRFGMRKSFGKTFTIIPSVEMLQLTIRINFDWKFQPKIEKKNADPDLMLRILIRKNNERNGKTIKVWLILIKLIKYVSNAMSFNHFFKWYWKCFSYFSYSNIFEKITMKKCSKNVVNEWMCQETVP